MLSDPLFQPGAHSVQFQKNRIRTEAAKVCIFNIFSSFIFYLFFQ